MTENRTQHLLSSYFLTNWIDFKLEIEWIIEELKNTQSESKKHRKITSKALLHERVIEKYQ